MACATPHSPFESVMRFATALVAGQLKPAPGSCDSNRTISASAQFRAIGQQTLSDDLRALTYYDNDGLPPTPILKHYRLNASSANLQTVPKANPGSRLVGGSKPDLVALVGTSSVVVFDALRTSDSKPIEEVPLNLNIPAIPPPPRSGSPHWSAVASYPSERASDFLFIPSPDSFRNSVESQKLALDSSVVLVQDHQQLWRDAARSQKLQAQFQQGSPLSGAILAMAATDLDGDEQLDVLFIENGPEPKLRVFGGSGCNPGLVIPTPPECLVKGARIEVGDINNDGATDIVISNLTDPAHPGAPGTTPINLCVLVNEFYSR